MPRSVTIASGKKNVQLPDGGHYDAGTTVTLTDAQWAQISSTAVSGGFLVDNGPTTTPGGDQVAVQGAAVTAPAAVTSVQEATVNGSDLATTQALANSLKTKYNALQADVAALRTTVASLRTNLTGTGKPLSS